MVIGVDPGVNGGIAFLHDGKVVAYKMPATERDIYDLLATGEESAPVVFWNPYIPCLVRVCRPVLSLAGATAF